MPETDVKTVSPERLNALRTLQAEFDVLTKRMGELHYQKKLITRETARIDEALDELELRRANEVSELQAEFNSTGTINLTTGEFIPD
jgi:hypothetical protein